MKNLRIGQKILIVVGAIFVLFGVGLAAIIGTTSFNNLTEIKQAELGRMSQILTGRISDMENNASVTALSFEENEPIATEIKLLTDLGPYYADPGSYFANDFVGSGGAIDDADKIFVFQAQLKLIQLLQSAKRLNDLSSVSFYLLSPFDVVANAEPALSLRIDNNTISVAKFTNKGNAASSIIYQVPASDFTPPAPDYFDISSAYSAPPEQFFIENNFKPATDTVEGLVFPYQWHKTDVPQSTIINKNGIPVIQTWYPVKIPVAHPETWETAVVPVGLVLIEQRLDAAAMGLFKNQLGLNVGLAQDDQLLITSLTNPGDTLPLLNQSNSQIVNLSQGDYYYNLAPIRFSDGTDTTLFAVVFSPLSELEQLTQSLRTQISVATLIAILLTSIIVYLSIRYLVNRPLGALMDGVQTVAAGNLNRSVVVQSRDELGQLALAFNQMAAQLKDLIGSLEQRVTARTRRLEIVATLGERLSAILNIDQLLEELVSQVKESFDYYHVHVYIVDDERENLVLRAGAGEAGAKMKAQNHQISLNAVTSLVARAARSGEVVTVDNVRQDTDWLPNPLLPNTHSEMAVPILLESQVVGVLDVQSDRVAGLDESDASLLRSLANQVAVAMNNARLFQKMRAANTEAEALNRRLTREAWQNIGSQVQTTGYVFTTAGVGPAPNEWLGSMERAVRQKRLALETYSTNGDNSQKTATSVAVPLTLRGEVIGAIGIERTGDRNWSEDELTTMRSVSEQIALALDTARLARETERSAWRDRVVSESTAQVWSTSEIDDVMRIAVSQLADKLHASEVVIRLGTEEELVNE